MTLPIILGVKRRLDAEKPIPGKNSTTRVKPETVLARDDYTCAYCSFRSTRWQRVIPRDWAVAPQGADSMVTACSFCEQCFALETVSAMGSGTLIWLPEIGQAELNHIARAIYVAKAEGKALAEIATKAQDILLARRADVKRRVGGDDPMLLATVLLENLDDNEYRNRAMKLDGVRLLPLDKRVIANPQGETNQFPNMVNYWRSPEGPFAKLPVASWQDLLHATTTTVGRA
jgi:intracellular multiplication protein IcmJ